MKIDYKKYEGHSKGPWVGTPSIDDLDNLTTDIKSKGDGNYTVACDVDIDANVSLIIDAPLLLARCKELEEQNSEMRGILLDNLIKFQDEDRLDKDFDVNPKNGATIEHIKCLLAKPEDR